MAAPSTKEEAQLLINPEKTNQRFSIFILLV